MKNLFKLFLILVFVTTYSQNKQCDEFIKNEIADKIRKYNSRNILPFFSENDKAWGYFDKDSKEILIQPVFKKHKFFDSYIFFDLESDLVNIKTNLECKFRLFGSLENYRIELPDSASASIVSFNQINERKKIKDIKGFEIDSENNLIAFNEKFFNKKSKQADLSDFFKIKNKAYAIFEKDDKFSIVSEDGNFVKGFVDLNNEPIFVYFDANDVLFLINQNDELYEIKSLKGKKSCKEKFKNRIYFMNSQVIGYELINIEGQKGIFDMIKFKWIIKPNLNIKIKSLEYSTNHDFYDGKSTFYKSDIIKNRKLADIYIVTEDNKVLDLNLVEYKP